jgi:hypothetical protein
MMPHPATKVRPIAVLAWTCLALTMNAESPAEKTLFTFSSATDTPAWQVVNDDVMGGVSRSRFHILTNGGAVFSGVVSLANNGGFASVRSAPVAESLGDWDVFVLRVRGDGRRYKFTVRSGSGFEAPVYQAAFPTRSGEWEEHRLPFKDFVPTFRGRVLTGAPALTSLKNVSVGILISDQQAGPFRLELGWGKVAAR